MTEQRLKISAVIVTHNSEGVIDRCVEALNKQNHPIDWLIIIDSGSENSAYLDHYHGSPGIVVKKCANIGYGPGNNEGYRLVPADCDYVVFLNPDTFLAVDGVAKAVQKFNISEDIAMVTGILNGYDCHHARPLGKYDSTGVFRAWYGRWYDRDQGREHQQVQYHHDEIIPAACGALLFVRCAALTTYLPAVFHPDFFMYKEDIELSMRLTRDGWKILFSPEITAFHGRGWQSRKQIAYSLRVEAAKNEVLLYRLYPSPYIIWAGLKYILVRFFRR